MAANILGAPVLDIGVERAMMIAKPLVDVSKYYPVKTSGPAISVAKLIAGVAAVNIPIIAYLVAERQKARNAKRPAAQPATPEVIIPGATETRPAYDFSGTEN